MINSTSVIDDVYNDTTTTPFSTHQDVLSSSVAPTTSGDPTGDAHRATGIDNSSSPEILGDRATSASLTRRTRLPVAAMSASPSSSPGTARYQRTGDGFPVALLWLPYAALTLLLSALLIASFVHFHCKNGHKYKKRRSTNGSENGDDTGSASTARHVAFSDDQSPAPGVSVITSAVTGFQYPSPPFGRQRQQVHPVCWDDEESGERRRRKCNGDVINERRPKGPGVRRKGDTSRLSVQFVANRNGSMVNMRCGGTPTRTTKLDPEDSRGSGWTRTRPAAAPRPSTARVAPSNSLIDSIRARGGWRSEKTRPPTMSTPSVDWPNGALYSAMRICQMDDTVEDWNRLVGCSNP